MGILYHWIVVTTHSGILRKSFTQEDNILVIDARGSHRAGENNIYLSEDKVKKRLLCDLNFLQCKLFWYNRG